MERWGNGRARAYFEAEVPSSYARPSDWSNVQQMTKWIRVSREGREGGREGGNLAGRI
jgi:fido (protein-threonine AMPylation protein)